MASSCGPLWAATRTEWVRLYNKADQYREINDTVHGPIPLFHPLNLIIDTREFQRLRRLRQLNGASAVFPSAEHSRFTHSLGVYHLANKAVQELAKRQPDLGISGSDQLCVCIAGLVHDLGHGPFSHLYDGLLLKEVDPESAWRHEEGSVRIFYRILCTHPEIANALRRYLDETDLLFIQELIDPPKEFMLDGKWQLRGRPKEKAFLYDFVSNVHTGMDVDKFDYFLRDSKLAPLSISFDYPTMERIFDHTRALLDEKRGYWRLAYSEKIKEDLKLVSEARIRLHKTVYQHKTTIAANMMLVEALLEADPFLKFKGENGNLYRISEAYKDMTAFIQLDDGIESVIRSSSDEKLEPAKDVFDRIDRRHIPRFVGSLKLDADRKWTATELTSGVLQGLSNGLREQRLSVRLVSFHGGLGLNSDPLDGVLLYDNQMRVCTDREKVARKGGGEKYAYFYLPFETDDDTRLRMRLAVAAFGEKL